MTATTHQELPPATTPAEGAALSLRGSLPEPRGAASLYRLTAAPRSLGEGEGSLRHSVFEIGAGTTRRGLILGRTRLGALGEFALHPAEAMRAARKLPFVWGVERMAAA